MNEDSKLVDNEHNTAAAKWKKSTTNNISNSFVDNKANEEKGDTNRGSNDDLAREDELFSQHQVLEMFLKSLLSSPRKALQGR